MRAPIGMEPLLRRLLLCGPWDHSRSDSRGRWEGPFGTVTVLGCPVPGPPFAVWVSTQTAMFDS